MSKFLDRLDRINRGTPTSLGFGLGTRPEKVPSMALLGTLTDPKKSAKGASTLAKIGADGALIDGTDMEGKLEELAQTLDKVPWGIRVHDLSGEQAVKYREKGCDFLAFQPEAAPLGALGDEDTGYLLCIQPDMDEQSLRAIEDLPIDAVLLPLKSVEPPLTLQHLITIGVVRSAFTKYLLVEITGALTAEELDGLKDIGVDGLVVDPNTLSVEELEGLRERLLALPKRHRNKPRYSPGAMLPRMAYDPSGGPSREAEEEEDEF